MFCPNLTSITTWGDDWGSSYQYLDVYFYKWAGYSNWGNTTTVTNYLNGLYIYFATLNSYYDDKDATTPIKQYFDYHDYILISENVWKLMNVLIQPTQISFLNGTNTTIFETGEKFIDSQNYISTYLFEIMFSLSPKRYKIQEYLLYQPVNVTRNLNSDIVSSLPIYPETTKFDQTTNTSTSEAKSKSEDVLYNLLNILAKIGGFYSFLNLVFGAVAGFVNNTLMKVELINQIKLKILNSKTNKFRYYNSSTKSQSKIQPLSVIEEEKIPSMSIDVFLMLL